MMERTSLLNYLSYERPVERGARLLSKLSPEGMMSPRLFVRPKASAKETSDSLSLGEMRWTKTNFVARCKITTQSFRHWDHERFSSPSSMLRDSAFATARGMNRSGVKRLVDENAAQQQHRRRTTPLRSARKSRRVTP